MYCHLGVQMSTYNILHPKNTRMKYILVLITVSLLSFNLMADTHALKNEHGADVIYRGFVVVTNDGDFTSDDYLRMVRLGANSQVIRLEMGKLASIKNGALDHDYLLKLDTLVQLGKNAGLKTVFKMTVYGVRGFSWEDFWVNKNNVNEAYIDGWKVIWNRYKDESSVLGYDIVNEPRKLTMDVTYSDLTDNYLVPLYKKLIDECQAINPDKYCMIQSIFMNKGEAVNGNQYAEFSQSIDRDKVLFAPHIYQENKALVKPTMLRFEKESKQLDAPVFIGEWGFPTFASTDTTLNGRLGQLNYMDFYIRTAELFDSLGVNSIKAWFSGNPRMQNFLPGGPSTWAIFQDENAVGTAERKYITDVIARPYPQTIAGELNSFIYNFATRTLHVHAVCDSKKGSSTLFVGANRHYPDGFSILINGESIGYYNPLKNVGIEMTNSQKDINPEWLIWDRQKQKLHITQWPRTYTDVHLQIVPGIVK